MQPKNGDMRQEADIGSGEKSSGQKETEEMIRQINPQQQQADPATGGKTGQPSPPPNQGQR